VATFLSQSKDRKLLPTAYVAFLKRFWVFLGFGIGKLKTTRQKPNKKAVSTRIYKMAFSCDIK
jgi:hypothetical protein